MGEGGCSAVGRPGNVVHKRNETTYKWMEPENVHPRPTTSSKSLQHVWTRLPQPHIQSHPYMHAGKLVSSLSCVHACMLMLGQMMRMVSDHACRQKCFRPFTAGESTRAQSMFSPRPPIHLQQVYMHYYVCSSCSCCCWWW